MAPPPASQRAELCAFLEGALTRALSAKTPGRPDMIARVWAVSREANRLTVNNITMDFDAVPTLVLEEVALVFLWWALLGAGWVERARLSFQYLAELVSANPGLVTGLAAAPAAQAPSVAREPEETDPIIFATECSTTLVPAIPLRVGGGNGRPRHLLRSSMNPVRVR